MTIGQLVRGALINDGGVSAIVSVRVYPTKLPQKPTYEAITFQRISNTAQQGSTNIRETRWQISCWALEYKESHILANAVKVAFENYRNTDIKYAYVVNEIDDYDDEAEVYRTIVDVILVTHND